MDLRALRASGSNEQKPFLRSPSGVPEQQLQAIDEMPLLLLNIELDLYAEVPLSDESTALLVKQWERLQDEAAKDAFGARIGAKLGPVLADCVDWDLKPPTPAQVTFATAIARQRGLDLPGDVLRFRGAMNDFLDAHAGPAKKGLAKRPPRSE